jgi:hypothetical protein
MKRATVILTTILFVMTGCGGNRLSTDAFITVDVTAKYPKKELILQDFMDVEYVPLETNDEFLCQGIVQAVGKEIIVITNNIRDGDIFIFDRSGKALRKINRKGQGGEEYINISRIILDEDNGELFVSDSNTRKLLVYDTDGNFKRSFGFREGAYYNNIYSFDREHLICNNGLMNSDGTSNRDPLMIVSKQDGSIAREIEIPFKEKKTTAMLSRNETTGVIYVAGPSSANYPVVPYFDRWLLVEPSADTLYCYSSDHTMTPFIARTPSIQSMDPEIFLFPGVLTGRYCFMQTTKKVYDFATREGFPSTSLMYDWQEKALFECTVYNDDYSNKKQIDMMTAPVNAEIATWQRLEAFDLVEACEKGELKGRLKEIAAGLDEDSNPVIMLIKHRK